MDINAIPVEIVQISNSFSNKNGFVVLLKEIGGDRKMQIIVATSDAQAIAVSLEKIETTRPVSHQFFEDILFNFDIMLKNVVIHTFESGIFYTTANFYTPQNKSLALDCRPSDAICMALRMGKPILVNEELFDIFQTIQANYTFSKSISLENLPTSKLQEMILMAIENEDFELADKIKKILNER